MVKQGDTVELGAMVARTGGGSSAAAWSSPISAITTDALAERCAEETAGWRRGSASADHFAYELLRRALAEECSDAFTYVCQIYSGLVANWVVRHPGFGLSGESVEFFAAAAFESFYFALRGARFARFPNVAAILAYLKMCVHTAIAQYLRGSGRRPTVPYDALENLPGDGSPGANVEASELWSWVCRQLPDPRARILAHAAFVEGLKPREIANAYPQHWSDARAATVALYNIRLALRAKAEQAAWVC